MTIVGRHYLEHGKPVTVLIQWGLKTRGETHGGPRNVLIEREDGSRTVRPFRGLRTYHPPTEEASMPYPTGIRVMMIADLYREHRRLGDDGPLRAALAASAARAPDQGLRLAHQPDQGLRVAHAPDQGLPDPPRLGGEQPAP